MPRDSPPKSMFWILSCVVTTAKNRKVDGYREAWVPLTSIYMGDCFSTKLFDFPYSRNRGYTATFVGQVERMVLNSSYWGLR